MLIILVPVGIYVRIAAPPRELHEQLKAIVSSHDIQKITAISLDSKTAEFLLHTSSKDAILTSDPQGGQRIRPYVVISVFGAKIGNQTLSCAMEERTDGLHIVPDWKLVKVSIQPLAIGLEGQIINPRH